jgi:membrane protein
MISDVIFLIKETFAEWSEDKASRLAAALSYYTLFSLAPLLVIVIAIASLFLGDDAARGAINSQIDGMIGEQGAEAVEDMIQSGDRNEEAGIIATIVGVVTLAFGAMGVFGQLYDSLNTIWEIEPINKKKGVVAGILDLLQKRFLSFTMVLSVGFLLLVSLVISAAIAALGDMVSARLPMPPFMMQVINFVISTGITTLMFALLYKYVPEAKIRWKDVWIGALVTALLFSAGKQLIGLYIGQSSTANTFGAAASFIVIMLWVYYSAQVFFLGAEFTQVYAREFGAGIVPDDDAIAVPDLSSIKEEALRAAKEGQTFSPANLARRTMERKAGEAPARGTVMAVSNVPLREGRGENIVVIKEAVPPKDVGPFAATFVAFWTFVIGIFLGLIRANRDKHA